MAPAPAPHAAALREGLALSHSEPQLLVTPEGVYHFSFRNPLLLVGTSFGAFLEDWLASGCFGSQSFDLLWKRVKSLVPVKVPPAKNAWIKAYKKQFPTL